MYYHISFLTSSLTLASFAFSDNNGALIFCRVLFGSFRGEFSEELGFKSVDRERFVLSFIFSTREVVTARVSESKLVMAKSELD